MGSNHSTLLNSQKYEFAQMELCFFQGCHGPLNFWKVIELRKKISRPWKVFESSGMSKTFLFFTPKILEKVIC